MRRILVLRAAGLGDLLVTVPALRGLRRRCPARHLVLATPAALAPLALAIGAADEVLPTASPAAFGLATGPAAGHRREPPRRWPTDHRALDAVQADPTDLALRRPAATRADQVVVHPDAAHRRGDPFVCDPDPALLGVGEVMRAACALLARQVREPAA